MPSGSAITSLIFYRHNSGANTTWRLFLYLDTSVTGLPVTPNGGNITVTFAGGGIFTISDSDAKEDIVEIGKIGSHELSVCRFRYHGQTKQRIGLIAQDVERKVPDAVADLGGVKAVNYELALAA